MAVNLIAKKADQLFEVNGVDLFVAEAGVRYANRKDLLLIQLGANSSVAGVFTQNQFCAAPVQICKIHLKLADSIRALIINTGNANAGTGKDGLERAKQICHSLAAKIGCESNQILPFSTGVTLETLPHEKILQALPSLRPANWLDAAEAIMTTDTIPKAVSRKLAVNGHSVTISGIAKGSGMIHPNMATLLSFIATDANIAQPLLERLTREIVNESFNNITVDGDTSTNDSFIIIASGKSSLPVISDELSPAYDELKIALTELAVELAQSMVRDAEGASKFISINVEGGITKEECRAVALAIAHSPLVKTAFFASDPNFGRIMVAIGYAKVENLEESKTDLYLGDVWVVKNGQRHPDYQEEDGQRVMNEAEINLRVKLNRGSASITLWSCDLSHAYVSINADYRS